MFGEEKELGKNDRSLKDSAHMSGISDLKREIVAYDLLRT